MTGSCGFDRHTQGGAAGQVRPHPFISAPSKGITPKWKRPLTSSAVPSIGAHDGALSSGNGADYAAGKRVDFATDFRSLEIGVIFFS